MQHGGYQNERLRHQEICNLPCIHHLNPNLQAAKNTNVQQPIAFPRCLWNTSLFATGTEVQCCHCGIRDCTLPLAECPCSMESMCTRDLCHQCGGNSFERCARMGYVIQMFNVDDINTCHGLGTYLPAGYYCWDLFHVALSQPHHPSIHCHVAFAQSRRVPRNFVILPFASL